jgi:hypothetical protein
MVIVIRNGFLWNQIVCNKWNSCIASFARARARERERQTDRERACMHKILISDFFWKRSIFIPIKNNTVEFENLFYFKHFLLELEGIFLKIY